MDHPVAGRIAQKFAPAIVAEIDQHFEEMIADLNGLGRLAARRYHEMITSKMPTILESGINVILDKEGPTTLEQLISRLFP